MNNIYYSGNTANVLLYETPTEEELNLFVNKGVTDFQPYELDIASISWTQTTPASPVYGYQSRDPLAYMPGNALCEGSIVLNYRTDVSIPEGRDIMLTTTDGEHTLDPLDGRTRSLTIRVGTSDPNSSPLNTTGLEDKRFDLTEFRIIDVHFQSVQAVVAPDGQPLQYMIQFLAGDVLYIPPVGFEGNSGPLTSALDDVLNLFTKTGSTIVHVAEVVADTAGTMSEIIAEALAAGYNEAKSQVYGNVIPRIDLLKDVELRTGSPTGPTEEEKQTLLNNLIIADNAWLANTTYTDPGTAISLDSDNANPYNDRIHEIDPKFSPSPAGRLLNYLTVVTADERQAAGDWFRDTFSLKPMLDDLRLMGVPIPKGMFEKEDWKSALRKTMTSKYQFSGDNQRLIVGVNHRFGHTIYYTATVTDGLFGLEEIPRDGWSIDELRTFLTIFHPKTIDP
jgi:hypothetical protein